MARGWQVLCTSSMNAGTEHFLFPKGSSLVFRENTGELHLPLTAHTLEDLQQELTAHSLVPFPGLCA